MLSVNTVYLDEDDEELRRAWSTFSDPVMEHHNEEWQYMGTAWRGEGWTHTFRHRSHPQTGRRASAEVVAASGWCPAIPDGSANPLGGTA